MKLLAAGGGSGGHVTPVLAVINELSKLDQQLEVRFVCDKAFESQSRGLMQHARVPVTVTTIHAGKLRRYHGETWLQRAVDMKTIASNVRDIFRVAVGYFQSIGVLTQFRPDIVFAKGGYVCLPLGLAARTLRIPLVIHDSDTRPGLTNRVLARFAVAIATGSPLENYPYPRAKTRYTGVPIDGGFHPFSVSEQLQAKQSLGVIDLHAPLVVVTGGGLGARSINEAVLRSAERLIAEGIHIYHITGKKHFQNMQARAVEHPHYHIVPFVYQNMASVLGAADLVIARGSATFLQELAGLAKPVIIIPAAHLGDQVKNAHVYQVAEAALVMTDAEIAEDEALARTAIDVLTQPARLAQLSLNLHQFAKPQAAYEIATLLKRYTSKGGG